MLLVKYNNEMKKELPHLKNRWYKIDSCEPMVLLSAWSPLIDITEARITLQPMAICILLSYAFNNDKHHINKSSIPIFKYNPHIILNLNSRSTNQSRFSIVNISAIKT